MKPLQAGVRVVSVGLLVAGVAGGYYVAEGRPTPQGQPTEDQLAWETQADDMRLLKEHQSEQAASRAMRTSAEGQAANLAASAAKTTAGKAENLDKAVKKAAADKKAAEKARTGGYTGPIPSSCNEYSGNRAAGCALLLQAGFGLDQMGCLDKLWTRESGWNQKAENKGSGAYGIPQSLPGSKMGAFGDDWQTNPATQIKWGLNYIKGRYSNPCGAWANSEKYGNY